MINESYRDYFTDPVRFVKNHRDYTGLNDEQRRKLATLIWIEIHLKATNSFTDLDKAKLAHYKQISLNASITAERLRER